MTISSVEDYNELRGLSAGSLDFVLVRQPDRPSYDIPLSSAPSGGIFVWDEFSTEAENHGTIIAPLVPRPNGNGRWKRQYDDTVSVKWFGAKGDMKEYYLFYDNVRKQNVTRRYQGSITAGKTVLKLILPAGLTGFMPNDINKTIVIWNNSKCFINKIKAFTDTETVELADPTKDTLLNAFVSWGTDDYTPIQQALDVARELGYAVYLPPGHFLITQTLKYTTFKLEHDPRYGTSSYELMRHGLRLFGAGMQVSFLHNLIETPIEPPPAPDYPSSRATIVIDGTGNTFKGSWQQSGYLKDFHITSTGHIDKTVGIDLLAVWAYTIQNVAVMKMGSDGIVIRNRYIEPETKISDFDASDKVHLDNVFTFKNDGWGIIVDAVDGGVSTGRIHLERCKIEENKGGGIQWVGQSGVIEQCGLYGNGVCPKGTRIQWTGIDGWTGEDGIIEQYGISVSGIYSKGTKQLEWPISVPNAYGIRVKNVVGMSNGLLITGCEIQGNADIQVMVEIGANIKITQNDFKDDDISERGTLPSIDIQVGDGNKGVGGRIPRSVIGCVIEDNRIRLRWKDGWGKYKDHPDLAKINQPKHTVVRVNTNAISTVIGRWWTSGYQEDDLRTLVELVEEFEKGPAGKLSTYTDNLLHNRAHSNTHLHRSGIDVLNEGGHVLLPFASRVINLDKDLIKEPVTVNTLKWSKFRFRIIGEIKSFTLENPTGRSIGVPLFLEFVSGTTDMLSTTVIFSDDYDIPGKNIIIPHGKTVTGILLFDESGKWLPFSPWTCEGKPL